MQRSSVFNANTRRFIVWTAIVALCLRSLIPAGFMPDYSAHGKGLFALTICDGTIHQHPADGTSHSHSDTCPYSVGAVYSFGGMDAVAVAPVFATVVNSMVAEDLFSPSAGFANVSPRSPPFFS